MGQGRARREACTPRNASSRHSPIPWGIGEHAPKRCWRMPSRTHPLTLWASGLVEGRPQSTSRSSSRGARLQLATATFIADATGELVFYNEPAEEILGRTFAEAGPMPAESWPSTFNLEDPEGPLAMDGCRRPSRSWSSGRRTVSSG